MPNLSKIYLEEFMPKCLKCYYQIGGTENEFVLPRYEKVFTEGWDDKRNLFLCSKVFGLAQRKHLTYALGF